MRNLPSSRHSSVHGHDKTPYTKILRKSLWLALQSYYMSSSGIQWQSGLRKLISYFSSLFLDRCSALLPEVIRSPHPHKNAWGENVCLPKVAVGALLGDQGPAADPAVAAAVTERNMVTNNKVCMQGIRSNSKSSYLFL